MRKLLLPAVVAAVVMAASASSAAAETWSGSCTFKGIGRFNPPYNYVVANRNYVATGRGTCTGTLDGRRYKGPAHIRIDGRMGAPMSCEAGVMQGAIVPGMLTFGKDPRRVRAKRLRLAIANVHSLFVDQFLVEGAYNGEAYGEWIFNVTFDTLRVCLPQNGLKQLKFTLNVQTIRQLYG